MENQNNNGQGNRGNGPPDQGVYVLSEPAPGRSREKDSIADKRAMIVRRLLYTVTQYNSEHGAIAMQILSAKYSRLCGDIGGFPELMMHLEDEGIILIQITKSGKQLVTASGPKPLVKHLF